MKKLDRLREYLKSAIKQLLNNKARTLMTMLGIIIGIAAVIMVIAMGNGMTEYITTQLDSFMSSEGYIYIDKKKTTEVVTRDDLKQVREEVPDIKGISPSYTSYETTVKITTRKGTYLGYIEAKSEGGLYANGGQMTSGTYFTSQQVDNAARVCVILDTDADKIFGTRDCLGMNVEITVGSISSIYTVIGLRTNGSQMLEMFRDPEVDYTVSIEMPYTSYGEDYGVKTEDITNIAIYADTRELASITKKARDTIAQNHGLRGSDAIHHWVDVGLSDSFESIIRGTRLFMIAIAIISLVVGGIGVMNIMLVSVTERTREIGIRKSIGARTSAVMIQFVAESAFLTLIGGILGIIVGIVASIFGCNILKFRFIISPLEILMAAMFSVLVGVFFGLYPARKAAGMRPIQALQNLSANVNNNRVRAFLTMLGIIIGIMSVLIVLIVTDGYEARTKQELKKKVAGVIIKLDVTKTDKYLTRAVYREIEDTYAGQIYGIDLVGGNSYSAETTSYRGKELSIDVIANGDACKQEGNLNITSGRFYSSDDVYESSRVCVIPENAAEAIFGYNDVVGETIPLTIGNKTVDLTVIGIKVPVEWDVLLAESDTYEFLIPYTTVCEIVEKNPDAVITSAKLILDQDCVEEILPGLQSTLENIMDLRGMHAVKVSRESDSSGYGNILKIVKYVGMIIAAISIVVGGVGVMNIMTVIVEERTREIGIMKSIGARTGVILMKFLGEASKLTLIGGCIGGVLGLVASFVACKMIGFPFVVDPLMVTLVVGSSVIIGILFGVNPAIRAAKLKPIDALRTD